MYLFLIFVLLQLYFSTCRDSDLVRLRRSAFQNKSTSFNAAG